MSKFLNVGFYNCNGLSYSKWDYVISAISSGKFDIIILAETWFVNQKFHESSPYFVVSSKMNQKKMISGRQKNGLMALATPSIRHFMSSSGATEYTITLQLFGLNVLGVYFPPSLSLETIKEYIPDIKISLLIGDINTCFGSRFGQVRNGPTDRVRYFDDLSFDRSMIHIRPETDNDYPDHVFCDSNTSAFLKVYTSSLYNPSDHSMIVCSVQTESEIKRESQYDSFRYNLKDIDDPIIKLKMIESYVFNRDFIIKVLEVMDLYDTNDDVNVYHDLIDYGYFTFSSLIHHICNEVLGVYSVHAAKSSDIPNSNSLKLLDSAKSSSIAAKIFKNSMKMSSKNNKISSRDPILSAVEDVYNYYSDLFKPPTEIVPQSPPIDFLPFSDEINSSNYFSQDSIKTAINGISDSKSAGPDNIHISVLKVFTESTVFLYDLSRFFYNFIKLGLTPTTWNLTQIHPIPKNNSGGTIDNFRPITITSTVRKIFENCLLEYIMTTSLVQVHPSQSGFRKDHSTIAALIVTNDLLFLSPPYIRSNRIFLDLSSAYDTVILDILLDKMRSRKISNQLISILSSLFSQCSSRVSVNGTLTDNFIRYTGLLQGSVLSPLLFNFYINDLACSLAAESHDGIPSALFYADDIQLLPVSKTHAEILLSLVSKWISKNGMKLNIKKSAFIGKSKWELAYNGKTLPTPDSYIYLGLPYTIKGFDLAEYCRSAGEQAKNLVKNLEINGKNWHPTVKLNIYKMFIRSIWEYPAPILNIACIKSMTEPIVEAQIAGLTWVTGVSIFHGKQYRRLISSLCGIESVPDRLEALGIRFCHSLKSASNSNVLINLLDLIRLKGIYTFPRAYVTFKIENLQAYSANYRLISLDMEKYLYEVKLKNLSKTLTISDRIHLIRPESRHPRTLADVSFYLSTKFLITQAIRWRMSSYGFGTDCPICHQKFKFTHVKRCLGILNFDKYFIFSKKKKLEIELKKLIELAPPSLDRNIQ
ncbi:LINE-1 reverse transcriptase-like protein [Smittium mucronatum]|uniref:LINE-1 reverse transcriptase-like protein n=1 Tax=Smittium mucronatum TaxID=133383 RepID=A0A1R0H7E0_9FUNG|nr:LINE-1 reverse transcriptase-like protein [Smittium mucronatum]